MPQQKASIKSRTKANSKLRRSKRDTTERYRIAPKSPPPPPKEKTVSQKHREFIRGPMVNTPVTDVPGIREEVGKVLKKRGIKTAKALYGCYLANRGTFKQLIGSSGGSHKDQNRAHKAMVAWDRLNN